VAGEWTSTRRRGNKEKGERHSALPWGAARAQPFLLSAFSIFSDFSGACGLGLEVLDLAAGGC